MKAFFLVVAHTLISKMLPASSGALLGSLFALLFFLFFYSTAISAGGEASLIIDGFLLFAVTFLAALFSNILAAFFLSVSNKNLPKKAFRGAMFHIFFINVGVLAISSPLFLLLPKTEGYVLSQFFLPFSALCSTLLLEIFLSPHNPLLGAQKAIFSGVCIAFLYFSFFPGVIPTEMMPFFLLPIVWFVIPLISLVVERVHVAFSS